MNTTEKQIPWYFTPAGVIVAGCLVAMARPKIRRGLRPMRWPDHRLALSLFLSVIVVWIAVMAILMRHASLPHEASGPMLAVFEPDTPPDDIFAKLTIAGARPIRETAFGFIWVVAGDEPGLAGRLAAQGAIGAYRELPLNPTIAGCFALADAKIAEYTGP